MALHDTALTWSPLFLGGPPKSGTTLLQALLDGHPDIMVFPEEAGLVERICAPTLRERLRPVDVEWLLRYGTLRNFAVDVAAWPSGLRDYRSIDFADLAARARRLWEHSDRRPADLLMCAIVAFAEITGETGKRYWAEKTPDNERHAEALARLWPDMKMIAVFREPRDNFVSFARHRQRRRREHVSAARFLGSWTQSLAACLRFIADGGAALVLTYEQLVEHPEREMRRIADFLGVPVTATMLQPTRGGVAWAGNSVHFTSQTATITTQSVGIHRRHLPEAVANAFASVLAPVYDAFGWHRNGAIDVGVNGIALPGDVDGTARERKRAARSVATLMSALADCDLRREAARTGEEQRR